MRMRAGRYGMLVSVALAMCVLLAEVTEAQVWYVSPGGSNTSSGASPATAINSIQGAINAASLAGGGTVYVLPGHYRENVELKSGVSVIGSGPEWTTIEGYSPYVPVTNPTPSEPCSQCHDFHGGNFLLDSITLPGGTVKAANVMNAILAGFTIELEGGNEFYHGWNRGVMVAGTTDATFALRNNVIYTPVSTVGDNDRAGVGIMVAAPATPTVLNNTFATDAADGMPTGKYGANLPAGEFHNNLFYGYNAALNSPDAALVKAYNHYSTNPITTSLGPGETYSEVGNPARLFTDGGFRLSLGSPAIDAGDSNEGYNDLDGSRNDVGAYGGNYLPDSDGDLIVYSAGFPIDNCPNDHNPGQEDWDNDGIGNICDPTPMGDAALPSGSSAIVSADGLVQVCVQWPAGTGADFFVPPDCANVQFALSDSSGPFEPNCLYPAAYDIAATVPYPAGGSSCVTCDLKERFPDLPATDSLAGITIDSIAYESFITDPWFDQNSGKCIDPVTGVVIDSTVTPNACRNLWIGRVEIPVAALRYAWDGFFSPIDNDALNKAKAGSSIPIKFSLGGNMGLAIFEAGSPSSVVATSLVGIVSGENVVTETAGGSGLSYDPATNVYTYVWKTQKSWAGTMRQLQVRLKDGTVHTANFTFTK